MKKISILKRKGHVFMVIFGCFVLMFLSTDIMAAANDGWGEIAKKATDSISSIGRLITAGSYLAGLAFSISAIMKFKQHKDNPTQVTIGAPIALTFVAAALLFLPSILKATGSTLFTDAQTAGPSGMIFKTKGGG